ncbi:MAG TPA: HDIG domain-containing protein [Firmicutes bacterium]|nr:HDIG domain-containing protein [Bacillota bacterium]
MPSTEPKAVKQKPWATLGVRRSLLVAAFFVLTLGVYYVHLFLWPQEFREGQVIPFTVFAPITFTYEDSELLSTLSGDVGEGEIIWQINPDVRTGALARLDEFKADLVELRQALPENGSDVEARTMISELASKYQLDPKIIERFLSFRDDKLSEIMDSASLALGLQLESPVTQETIRQLRQGGTALVLTSPDQIYVNFLQPNMTQYKPPDISQEVREMAQVDVEKGSVIIAEGREITRRVKEQLNALSPHLAEQRLFRFLGVVVILAGSILFWFMYMRRFSSELLSRLSTIGQLGTLVLGFTVLGLLIGRLPFNYFYFGVTFAVVAMAALVVLVYDSMLALYLALGLALMLSVGLQFEADLMLYTMAGALLPSIALSKDSNRRNQLLFSLGIALLNVLVALTVALISVQTIQWEVLVIAAAAGFGAAVLALGLLPIIETLSVQLTPGKLMELANQENELLKRLKREAIGTYAHSVMVADLSEEGCRSIGGDWLRAKVGALYHDIGKIKRPGFFAENIHDLSKNPHTQIPPETSVKILRDHVTDGLAMAREARLPVQLCPFIGEHHGTYLIKYFYYKALAAHEESPEEVPAPEPKDFSYGGPIPQSRESGVVMLADVTEAVTRARADASPEELKQIVATIVAEKIDEGQLGKSGLTVGDLEKVKAAFNRTLAAQRHQRVSYPGKGPAPIQFHFLQKELPGAPVATVTAETKG